MVDVSVIVCTHNPDADLIARAFDGLRRQTFDPGRWELLVIDNASTPALPARLGGILPFNARCILEPTVGLTAARIRGISESAGSLLVFVDDDAVLCPDYLDVAWRISQKYPFVGAFGGSIELEFSSPPADWTRPHWPRLAERSVKKELWSNFECRSQTTPWGVGMCLQKAVATRYIELTTSDPVRLKLDRSGMSLVSGGDEDMARTSHSLGLATGLFPELNLIHLIPPRRLELDYLLRLVEGQSYSGMVLNHLYQDSVQPRPLTKLRRIFGTLRRRLFMGSRERLFFEARLNGQQRAIQDLSAVH